MENLPEDHSVENLNRVFGEAGKYASFNFLSFLLGSYLFLVHVTVSLLLYTRIKNITIRDPHDARESKKCTVAEKLISGKVC